ncbi:MAG: hypothetical protein FWD43_03960 [Coriobacteriia bacterium]|nr:hypothetical protein [Coriobacteriia bacterium]
MTFYPANLSIEEAAETLNVYEFLAYLEQLRAIRWDPPVIKDLEKLWYNPQIQKEYRRWKRNRKKRLAVSQS